MFGFKKSKFYFWNNRIACWGFFLVRIVVIPIAWYHFYLHSTEFYMFTENIYYYAATIIMLILSDWQNINWFSRLYASCYTPKRIKTN
ncbi:unnamed protein product [Oikopleura dioica]|uniref:Uncharacterized protein n=1 Tax=Oikopleura dioica TaxID=34765 RepID=E4WT03_OIKDI|nr:unnamed protein product [Oikopleura dioica]